MTDAKSRAGSRHTHGHLRGVMAISTFALLYAGITGARGVWLWVVLVLLGIEVVVFANNGMKCPLTAVAVKYGAKTVTSSTRSCQNGSLDTRSGSSARPWASHCFFSCCADRE